MKLTTHFHLVTSEVKECVELYFHSMNTPSWRGGQLKMLQRIEKVGYPG